MAESHKSAAAQLAFDLTKQFITLALGGIAFVVGLSFSSPNVVSSTLLWSTVAVFGVSTLLGLLFLGHGVSRLDNESYDVYATALRWLSILQIVLVLTGVVLLCPILANRSAASKSQDVKSIDIRLAPDQSITLPVEPDKSYTIDIEAGKAKVTTNK